MAQFLPLEKKLVRTPMIKLIRFPTDLGHRSWLCGAQGGNILALGIIQPRAPSIIHMQDA